MGRRNVISRFATLVFATIACLLLAVLAPILFGPRATDEPFSGYAVMASPRDMHVITTPIRLSEAPDLTLSRGTLYADGNAAAGTPISRFVLDAPVFHLNVSGLSAGAPGLESALSNMGQARRSMVNNANGSLVESNGRACADVAQLMVVRWT